MNLQIWRKLCFSRDLYMICVYTNYTMSKSGNQFLMMLYRIIFAKNGPVNFFPHIMGSLRMFCSFVNFIVSKVYSNPQASTSQARNLSLFSTWIRRYLPARNSPPKVVLMASHCSTVMSTRPAWHSGFFA